MNYEVINVLHPEASVFKAQKERLERKKSTLITLAPDPETSRKQQQAGLKTINIVNYVTGLTADPNTFMFFNQAPVVDGAEIFMNQAREIDIIKDGQRIGAVRTYNNSRRLVNSVTYFNQDGSKDFVEEYAYDGKLFSRLYYDDGKVQQILFYNDDQNVVLTYYFYEQQVNLVTVEDPRVHKVIEKYNNLNEFLTAKVAEIVTVNDQVGILYLGVELSVLSQTESVNTLYPGESPLDENGQVRGNLHAILNNQIQYVQHVVVDQTAAAELKAAGEPMDKLIIK